MSETGQDDTPPSAVRRWLIPAVLGAGASIVLAMSAINAGWLGGSAVANDCIDRPALREALDAAAQGELAAFRATAEGANYDELSFLAPDGSETDMTDLRGKVLLVNFWATWCGPCKREMPALSALQTRYGGEDFDVITIDLDLGEDGPEKARRFLRDDMGIDNLPLYADPTMASFNVLKQRGVTFGLPTTLLLDAQGCEVGVLGGPAEWDTEDGHALIEAALAA